MVEPSVTWVITSLSSYPTKILSCDKKVRESLSYEFLMTRHGFRDGQIESPVDSDSNHSFRIESGYIFAYVTTPPLVERARLKLDNLSQAKLKCTHKAKIKHVRLG